MKTLLVLTTISILALNAIGQCSDADRKALEAFDAEWTKAGQAGDKATLMTIYADEYAGIPTMQMKAQAIDATMAAFERNKANPQNADKTTADHYMIACTPVTATVTHRNVTFRPTANGGKGDTVFSRSVHFLEKRNGKWVVVSNAGGPLSDSDILRYMELDWMNAVKTKNMDWFENNLATDFTEIGFLTGDVMNKRQAMEGLRNDKTVYDVMEVSDISVRIDGNTGIVTGIGWGKGTGGDGKPFDMRLRFTDTFIKRDGRWQPWAAQATLLPKRTETATK